MRQLSSDLCEFIHLLNTKRVESLISQEHLIQNKRAANRAKDRGDIELLEKTKP